VGKHDYRERTRGLLGAKVEEVDAAAASFYVENFTGDAFGFADMLAGFGEREAVGDS
jgi:hypothetical protein